ncbi:MAG TPA: 16S rRNA (cytosine(1402)-N(4))-methyltransferase RsmH [Mycobacteriales bacterium]
MGTTPTHVPVLRDRVLALLAPALAGPGAVAVDATLGLGGHSLALLEAHPDLRLIGIDRDPEALRLASARLSAYSDRISLHQAVYDEIPSVLAAAGMSRVDGVLFDLGVSSLQLDEARRGFAYAQDAPLDMRMSSSGMTAADVVNGYSEDELTRILRDYGEERWARRIAQFIVRERPVTSSARLVELVRDAIPAAARRTGGNPAKRTFQALRIEVNRELSALTAAMPAAIDAVRVGGRVVVLSYHSLEDRIVKQAFVSRARDTSPPGLPVPLPSAAPTLRVLTRGAEAPTEEEIAANPRAGSARLRAAERLRDAA